jgi:hypothetical protein
MTTYDVQEQYLPGPKLGLQAKRARKDGGLGGLGLPDMSATSSSTFENIIS